MTYIKPGRDSSDGSARPSRLQVRTLREAKSQLAQVADRRALGQIATDATRRLLRADQAAFVLRTVPAPRVASESPSDAPGGEWPRDALVACLDSGSTLREVRLGVGPEALIAVPIPCAARVAGALVARRCGADPFSAADVDAAERLAREVGVALDDVSRRGAVTAMTGDIDVLTGLPTRPRLMADLRAALGSARRSDHTPDWVAVMLVAVRQARVLRGLDGPAAAGDLLLAVADVIGAALRPGDIVYRWGRDELAVLLPSTTQPEGLLVGDRVAAAIAEAGIEPHHSGVPGPVRVAIGVVAAEGGLAELLATRAVEALAEAGWSIDVLAPSASP